MKILFSVSHFGFLRNFEPALRRLASRGHRIHLLAERHDNLGGTTTIDNLAAAHPDSFTYDYAPSRKGDPYHLLALKLRLCLDYWRYLDPRYDQARSLRDRGARQAPAIASRLAAAPLLRSRAGIRVLRAIARRIERALPYGRVPAALLEEHRPDAMLLTPLLYFGSPQVDYVRAARDRGIATCHCVGSWDHLTTKGTIHEIPDRLTVWNEAQRREAAEIHGVPPERVAVTGAQAYDHWFTATPSTSRDEFCARVGLGPSRPILLYLCSSPFIAPREVPFVRRWLEAIRASDDERVRMAGVLIRPHPQNADQWRDVDFDETSLRTLDPGTLNPRTPNLEPRTELEHEPGTVNLEPRTSVWPRAGANPVDTDARAAYFDSMYHAVAVVGINTSAQIEAGIVGRPVCAIQADEFGAEQEGTLHFQHLKHVNGGLLHLAPTFEAHVEQLSRILAAPEEFAARSRAFIETFVRPHGLAEPAADHFVRAIESLPGTAASPVARGALDRLITRAMRPVARAVEAATARRKAERRGGSRTVPTPAK